jgi:hypothetical protein
MIRIRAEIYLLGTQGQAIEKVGDAEVQVGQPALEITPELFRGNIKDFDSNEDCGFNAVNGSQEPREVGGSRG